MMGEWLADLRKDKGLTQTELAAILGIDRRNYGNYERGCREPNDELKIKIARYFNVSLDYLLGLIREPRPLDDENKYVRLPRPLSEKSMEDLQEYIRYLVQRDQEDEK
ncbi:MAG: helix-turn-helix transcriptional regulator [Clostridiales bacterium]|nr:helix-turn-helix transcriptional regulator [Clostridiales bacterium]